MENTNSNINLLNTRIETNISLPPYNTTAAITGYQNAKRTMYINLKTVYSIINTIESNSVFLLYLCYVFYELFLKCSLSIENARELISEKEYKHDIKNILTKCHLANDKRAIIEHDIQLITGCEIKHYPDLRYNFSFKQLKRLLENNSATSTNVALCNIDQKAEEIGKVKKNIIERFDNEF